MPEYDPKQRQTAAADRGQVADAPESTSAREALRQKAGQTGYDEGNAMLKPERAPLPAAQKDADKKPNAEEAAKQAAKKKEDERLAAARKSYEEALGKFLGGKLFDLVHKELGPDKLLKYGKQGLEAMGKAADGIEPTEAGVAGGIMDEAAEAAAVQKFSGALLGWAKTKGEEWLAGKDGQALLLSMNHWVEDHPRTVALTLITTALSAAVVAYVSNVDLPTLKKDFKLSDELKAHLGANLGKIQDIALRSADASLSYQGKIVHASLSGHYEDKDGTDAYKVTAAAGFKTANANANTTAEVDQDGNLKVDASAALHSGKFAMNAGGTVHKPADGELASTVHATVQVGDKSDLTKVDGVYNSADDTFTLQTSRTRVFESDGATLRDTQTTGPGGQTHNVSADVALGAHTSLSLGASQKDGKTESGKASAKADFGWLKAQLDYEMGKNKETFGAHTDLSHGALSGSGDFRFDLDANRMQSLSLKLGYNDPDELHRFMLDYSRKWVDDNKGYQDDIKGLVETSLFGVAARFQADATLQGGSLQSAGIEGLAAYKLNDDLALLGGARYDLGPSATPAGGMEGHASALAGVQFKGVPLVVGYTPDTKQFTAGVRIPFDLSKIFR